jgi:hypothetical protein
MSEHVGVTPPVTLPTPIRRKLSEASKTEPDRAMQTHTVRISLYKLLSDPTLNIAVHRGAACRRCKRRDGAESPFQRTYIAAVVATSRSCD